MGVCSVARDPIAPFVGTKIDCPVSRIFRQRPKPAAANICSKRGRLAEYIRGPTPQGDLMIVQAIVALLQQAPEIDRATVRSSSFIARPPITSSRVSGGSNATRRRSRGDPSSVFLSTLAALSAAFFLRHRRRARQAKNISRADRRHAEGSTCCCLLPHHPHSRPPVRLHHPGSRHHPARRQCPRNCDARTAFSGRAEKKRRGSPGGFPRRLEADVQCSRSMHRNDRRSLKRLAENRQSRSSLLVSSLSLRRGRSRGRRAGAFETAWNKIPSFKSTCVVPKNTAIPHSISTSKKHRIYWPSEDRFREGYSVHPAVTSLSPPWTPPSLQWPRFLPRALRVPCLVIRTPIITADAPLPLSSRRCRRTRVVA